MNMSDPTERFTAAAKNYALYRPDYPSAILPLLEKVCQLKTSSIIADIGSGTGLLTRMFLEHGNIVYGVEPNGTMRACGEDFLKNYQNFVSIAGSAEETHLSDHSIDFITVGTAFHWFNSVRTRIEFERILRSQGYVVLIWNVRDKEASPLMEGYENLLYEFCSLQTNSRAQAFENTVPSNFFRRDTQQTFSLAHQQILNWESFCGRLLSTSYALQPSHPRHQAMMDALRNIYDRYQHNSRVRMQYRTEIVLGHL